jgi:hypothetical protein
MIISKVTPISLRLLPSVTRMEYCPKETTTNFSIEYVGGPHLWHRVSRQLMYATDPRQPESSTSELWKPEVSHHHGYEFHHFDMLHSH